LSDLTQLAADLRQQAVKLQQDAEKLQSAASILDGLPGGAPVAQDSPGLLPAQGFAPQQPSADELAELKRLRDYKSEAARRVTGLEQRINTQQRHIDALEARLRETDESDSTRIKTLQNECGKLREQVAALKSEKFSVEEDLKSARGHVQELEALLEGATLPEAARGTPIGDLMPTGEPLATAKMRNGVAGSTGRVQALFTLPRNPAVLADYGDKHVGKEFAIWLRDGAIVARPLEQAAEVAEPPPVEEPEPQEEEPPAPPEPPEPAAPAEEVIRPLPHGKKLTFEQFRDWARPRGEFTRPMGEAHFNVSAPTFKKMLDEGMAKGIIRKVKDSTYSQSGRAPAVYVYVKPTEEGNAARMDRENKPPAEPVESYNPPKRGAPVAGSGKQFKGSGNPEVRALIEACRQAGATISPTDGGHIAVTFSDPQGQSKRVVISSTPSDVRTVPNDRSRLRRAGLNI
jgi:hypothetical protein